MWQADSPWNCVTVTPTAPQSAVSAVLWACDIHYTLTVTYLHQQVFDHVIYGSGF